ncbi:SPASM domain-containing protein [Streptomyces sp. NPDC085460]|uniref:SPASM domain-containing protein n=1 Tax=Streptomyces sp. NPDC085460 TaxID=3365723 RepID=UPI0037D219E4
MPEFEQITTTAQPSPYSSATKALHAARATFLPGPLERGVKIRSAPWSLEMYATFACNTKCDHCYAKNRNAEYGFASMPVEMMDRLHDSIISMGVRGVQYCGGGEPTQWRGGKIADYIARLPLATTRAGMASNLIKGMPLARPDVLRRMTFIEVAVFAYDDDTYEQVAHTRSHTAMETAARAIIATRDAAGLTTPKVNAKVLINATNYRWLERIYDWADSVGFDNIHIRLVDDYEKTGEPFVLDTAQREEFREQLLRLADERGLPAWREQAGHILGEHAKGADGAHRWCWTVAAGFNCWVLANGEVYACGPQWGRSEYLIGDLRENNLEDIWGSERHQQVARRLISNMALSGCYRMGCRHIHQTRAIDAWQTGDLTAPGEQEFENQHAWFL